MRVFKNGHRLLTRYIWKAIEIFVNAQAAFKIGK
jgi:hypothetical protein